VVIKGVLELIGNTPTVMLTRVPMSTRCRLFVKLEGFNPTGSIKDRAALYMVRGAVAGGRLRPGGTIIESTSGNLGKSLALVGANLGYNVILVMDPKAPTHAIDFCKTMGAEVVCVDEPDESGGFQAARVRRVRELLRSLPGSYWPDQYSNPDNPRSHAETTAREILRDVPDIDILVAAVSTGGHLSGTAGAIRRFRPNLQVIAVDAVGSSIFGGHYKPYLINGIGLSWRPTNLELSLVARVHFVSDMEAAIGCLTVARHEGLMLGPSGGAVVFASLRAMFEAPTKRVLGIIPDSGYNYFDTFFNDAWRKRNSMEVRSLGVAEFRKLVSASSSVAVVGYGG
jgi:2,3-diaminopropionate biosynthesis protein SbnA